MDMTEIKRPLKVFLCHAHSDRNTVKALYTRLTKDGVDVWLDKENLLPGQDWELEISKAVREADVVVVCLSKQFNQAGFRQKEVKLALDTAMNQPEGEIFIIPARLDECDTLESLRKWHWVDLFEEDGYQILMRALRVRANKIGAILQVKKNWLPKITPSHMDVETKKSLTTGKDKPKEEAGTGKEKVKPFEETALKKVAQVEVEDIDLENAKRESDEKARLEKVVRQSTRQDTLAKTISKFFTAIKSSPPKFVGLISIIIIGLVLLGSWVTSNLPTPVPTVTTTKTLAATLTPKPPSPTRTFTLTASPTLTKTSTPTPLAIGGDTFDKITLLGKIVPENGSFTSADISPDGQIIAVSLYYGTANSIQLWKTEDVTLLKTFETQGQYITNILFSPDGSLLASGDNSGTLKIWMVKTGEQIQSLNDTTAGIQKIGFSKDGRKLIASTSSRIEVWDVKTGELLSAVNMTADQSIQSFVVDLNDNFGYVIYERYVSRYIYPLNPITGKYSTISEPEWSARYITSYGKLEDVEKLPQLFDTNFSQVLDFSQNGEMLLGMIWGRISILSFANKEVKSSFDKFSYSGNQAIFSPDNRSIAMANYSNLSLLNIGDGKLERIPSPHKYSITSLAFSHNGWILISSSSDSLNIWGIPRWNSTPTPTVAPPTAVR
jgi:WD40 repeat protein